MACLCFLPNSLATLLSGRQTGHGINTCNQDLESLAQTSGGTVAPS